MGNFKIRRSDPISHLRYLSIRPAQESWQNSKISGRLFRLLDAPVHRCLLDQITAHQRTEGKPYNFSLLSRRALLTTDTELKLMAAAAIIGLSNRPKAG